jgi:hypothetical protein
VTTALLAFLLIALVAGVMLMAMVSRPNRRSRRPQTNRSKRGAMVLNRQAAAERWAAIEAMSQGGGNGLRQAISEADKLLDNALRAAGAGGDTTGERLKSAQSQFSSYPVYDGAWRAHKLRNALAHEVGFDLVASQATAALADFRRAIRDLGGL